MRLLPQIKSSSLFGKPGPCFAAKMPATCGACNARQKCVGSPFFVQPRAEFAVNWGLGSRIRSERGNIPCSVLSPKPTCTFGEAPLFRHGPNCCYCVRLPAISDGQQQKRWYTFPMPSLLNLTLRKLGFQSLYSISRQTLYPCKPTPSWRTKIRHPRTQTNTTPASMRNGRTRFFPRRERLPLQ